jgi:Fic-DOC domain mobile mystery protein B
MGQLRGNPHDEPDGASPFDASGLKLKHIRTRQQLNVAEAKNIGRAITKYMASTPSVRKAPFTLEWGYKLHREMFSDVWEWAGQRRNSELNIGFPFSRIDPGLKDLFDDLATWSQHRSYSITEQAVRLHHRSVLIHPFNNGNGRWARLLANIWLKRHNAAPVEWPDETIGREGVIRHEYLDAVKAADKGDLEPLLSLHRRYSS